MNPRREARRIFLNFAGMHSCAVRRGRGACEGSRPAGPHRVLRGGSWINNDPSNLLSSNRNNDQPTNRNDNNGFRLVLVVGAGGKALQPTDQRGGRPGRKPRLPRAKNCLTRTASPWTKRAHGWGVAACHAWNWQSPWIKSATPARDKTRCPPVVMVHP